jgi:hypothetical protein
MPGPNAWVRSIHSHERRRASTSVRESSIPEG